MVTDYTTKIEEICDALGSIKVTMDEDEMVQICFGDLTQWYRQICTTICTQEKPLSFFNLQSMLLVEKQRGFIKEHALAVSRVYVQDRDVTAEVLN